jgi:hypothetical protein
MGRCKPNIIYISRETIIINLAYIYYSGGIPIDNPKNLFLQLSTEISDMTTLTSLIFIFIFKAKLSRVNTQA